MLIPAVVTGGRRWFGRQGRVGDAVGGAAFFDWKSITRPGILGSGLKRV